MYKPSFAAFVLAASAVLPASAWLPVHKRSETALDLGILPDLNSFYQELGLDVNSTWEDIEAIAKEDAEMEATTVSANTPVNIGLSKQDDTCAALTGYASILCANMPSREAWWATGGALAIWYAPDVLIKWTDATAHVIITARSLRQMKDGNNLCCN
ncbi:hypothetical protein BKA67DRAFT_659749 [Truncatella angustata]|uniref:Uncharacterized protein n=1 Tax=Truncatella angustata TaxID=152316 RepID=A0A9P8UIQ4_9PEZI|nr:uncharacterized protein BKA67DRAFT_659749 [Truncatella angustata]KAH6653108.1 hypothetical protein BKA67DRAFT_659749 [Truncatella angustata]